MSECPKCGKELEMMENPDEPKYVYFVCHPCEYVVKRIRCEVYSRCVGYLRPVSCWNLGKKQEFKERKTYKLRGKDATTN